ncbi:hypothetical protein H8356DRAFT_1295707 [Neocallimastix lanati (nom. inval.)]|uniref:Uncharacterized protein n=1 Tax=Neocallimastix californiae TaxID=1754190 RepID=A0A1Y2AD83_9FUNG|nr:hypothetical protein H8356DRAFT_1295707 [Neocallimastix sp. JGI-2020a]ORY20250.1 hypothetical protein LY90DRAFT_516929 [Neocallimastix californiae]|eukprot:ORY20250.1 hypothetical protein LY90DRAFT_516929 [Neocallimastix californiae]
MGIINYVLTLINILFLITHKVYSMHCGVERFNSKLLDNNIKIIDKNGKKNILHYCKYNNYNEVRNQLKCQIKSPWYNILAEDVTLITFKSFTEEEMNYYSRILKPCNCRTAKEVNIQINEIMKNDTNKIITTDTLDMRNSNPTNFMYTFNNNNDCSLSIPISFIEIIDNSLFGNKKNTIFYSRVAVCLSVMISSGALTANPFGLLSTTILGGLFCPEIAKKGLDKYEKQELTYILKLKE